MDVLVDQNSFYGFGGCRRLGNWPTFLIQSQPAPDGASARRRFAPGVLIAEFPG
jgi:hypothetical protein